MIIGREVDVRYTVDCIGLIRARMRAGVSQREFADLCGWTNKYQSKLENGTYATVGHDCMLRLTEAFAELGIEVEVVEWS